MEEKEEQRLVETIRTNPIVGEQIIFDVLIKDKLAHVIVIKDGYDYHINLDGEDIGHFVKDLDGEVSRYMQPKGAHQDVASYFKPIEKKLAELGK